MDSEAGWREFAGTLAEIYPGTEIVPEARLIEDLSLDSLALAELIVFLIEKYGSSSLSRQLEDRTWEGVTIRMLFEECLGSVPGAAAGARQPPRR